MLSEGSEERSMYHAFAALFKEIIKRAGTTRAMSSIIKSGQKDTEASIIKVFTCIKTAWNRVTKMFATVLTTIITITRPGFNSKIVQFFIIEFFYNCFHGKRPRWELKHVKSEKDQFLL